MTLPGIRTQRDPQWAYDELGYNTDPYYNLYHFGCLITSVSNLLWNVGNGATPRDVNNYLKANNGFEGGGGNMIWGVANNLLAQSNIQARGYSDNLNDVNNFLVAEDNFAIVWITKPGFPQHWALSPFVGMIADPWDGVLKPTTSYTFHGAHLYSKTPVVTPAPPVQAIPVVEPEPITPIPDPVPTPVPSNETPQPDPNPNVIPILDVEIPDHERTYVAFPETKHLTTYIDTDAIDAEALGVNKPYPAGTRFALSGKFTDGGRDFYRGTSGAWYGIPVEAFNNGQPSGKIPIRISNLSIGTSVVAVTAELSKGVGWVRRLLHFLLDIIRPNPHK